MVSLPHAQCPAKTTARGAPGIPVRDHCRQVAVVARALFQRLPRGLRVRLGTDPVPVAAVHDVGKVSPGFIKKYFNDWLSLKEPDLAAMPISAFDTDHTAIGAAAVNRYLEARFRSMPVADIVGAHHGRGHKKVPRTDMGGTFGGSAWADERRRLIEELIERFGPLPAGEMTPVVRNILAGLVTVADWIGSDETFFPAGGLAAEVDPGQRADSAVTACGLDPPRFRPGLSFQDVFNVDPYPLQTAFIQSAIEPGLYILEAPMGTGKTEAALYAAYQLMAAGHHHGLFFGLPTRLTSDRIHERVRAFLERVADDDTVPALAHGQAWLRAYEHGGEALRLGRSWSSPRKRTLLHPVAVGTVDQALMSVIRVKHFFVRSFALAGKVVILDEVHTYDMYTGSLLEWMTAQLLAAGATVIVLSATLTSDGRRRLFPDPAVAPADTEYPLVAYARGDQAGAIACEGPADRHHRLRLAEMDPSDVARLASEMADTGHCVLCIANTVAMAQAWHDAIAAEQTEGGPPLGLLHSRFPAFQREAIETDWMMRLGKTGNRPPGCILVATQVVEQSLDIDADLLITALCPMDMLLQRMGRQWRHHRPGRPGNEPETVIISGSPEGAADADGIIAALGESNCRVYMPYVLLRTFQVLREMDHLAIPGDIRELIRATYAAAPADEPAAAAELREQLTARRDRLRRYAEAARADVKSLGVLEDREGVATRYSDLPSVNVLLLDDLRPDGRAARITPVDGNGPVTVHADRPDPPTTARLHRNRLSIPAYWIDRPDGIHAPVWLARHFYEPTAVLLRDPQSGALTLDGEPTGLWYDPRRGLHRPSSSAQPATGPPADPGGAGGIDITQLDW